MSLPVESTNSRSVTSPSTFRSNSAAGYAIGASGLSATGASDSGGGAAWLVCPSGCRDPPRQAVSPNATSNSDRTSVASIFAALLPRREPIQGVERRQRIDVEAVELKKQGIRARGWGLAEQPELTRIEWCGSRLLCDMMPGFEQLEHLPRSRDDRGGQPREPTDVNSIGAVGAARLEPVQEYDFLADLTHRDIEVADVLELLGELGQLVIVSRKDRFASDAVVQAFGDGPRDRHAVVGRRATADLIERHQAARGRRMQDRARLAHLDHERRLAAHQVVGRADPGEEAIDDADAGAAAGDERTDLREHDAEANLAEQRGLSGHVGPGEQHDAARLVERHVVGNERLARHHPLHDRMPAALELQREVARHLRPHIPLA